MASPSVALGASISISIGRNALAIQPGSDPSQTLGPLRLALVRFFGLAAPCGAYWGGMKPDPPPNALYAVWPPKAALPYAACCPHAA